MNGKPSSPVLRGLGASNGARLLDPNRVTSELSVTRPESSSTIQPIAATFPEPRLWPGDGRARYTPEILERVVLKSELVCTLHCECLRVVTRIDRYKITRIDTLFHPVYE